VLAGTKVNRGHHRVRSTQTSIRRRAVVHYISAASSQLWVRNNQQENQLLLRTSRSYDVKRLPTSIAEG